MLKQPQYQPLPVEDQVAVIYAGVNGHLDKVEVDDVSDFEDKFLSAIRDKGEDILKTIREEKDISEDTEKKLEEFCEDFAKKYA